MADELVKQYGSWLICVMVLGSLVDIFQFTWIVRRAHKRWRRALYNKVKRDLIIEQAEKGLK